ncbi:MAG: hypothetical protein ACI9XO_001149 [Paraglaciecola sp.]|jgi:hypothetical protein
MKLIQGIIAILFIFCQTILFAQITDGINPQNTHSKGIEEIGISNDALIEELMPLMPGLGSSSREMLTEQSIKSYMMPPRKVSERSSMESYALATLLEFYVNFDNNYKVNLSPDYIALNLAQKEKYDLKSAFEFLISEGTVSAAIMAYDAMSIPRSVYATEKFTIANYLRVVRPEMRAQQRIFETKKALMRGNPMLAIINVPEDFEDLSDTRYWVSGKSKNTKLQPFIVVGYDQDLEAFEVAGFWGNGWADNGYLWIEYDDFGKLVENGYVMMPNKE